MADCFRFLARRRQAAAEVTPIGLPGRPPPSRYKLSLRWRAVATLRQRHLPDLGVLDLLAFLLLQQVRETRYS